MKNKEILVYIPAEQFIEIKQKELNLECLKMAERNHIALECDMIKLASVYVNFIYNGVSLD